MKILKNLFSFMLVAVFALTGTLMLTACKKEEQPDVEPPTVELTREQKIEVVEDVLNDAITKNEIAQLFDLGDVVQPRSEINDSVFAKFGDVVVNEATSFETITADYMNLVGIDSNDDTLMEVMPVILDVIEIENFDFNTKVIYDVAEGDEVVNVTVKLTFDENYFVFMIYEEDEAFSFYKFNYSNNSIISIETLDDGSYEKFNISTDISKRALDSYILINKRTHNYEGIGNVTGYYCTIYSEEEGKCFTAARDMLTESPESIIQFVYGSETYGEMVEECINIFNENQALLESLN